MTKKFDKPVTTFTVRVETDLWKVFHMILKAQGTNPTNALRSFVVEYIKQHKDDIFHAVNVINGFEVEAAVEGAERSFDVDNENAGRGREVRTDDFLEFASMMSEN